MPKPAPSIPVNSIASEVFLEDVFAAVRLRLRLVESIDPRRFNGSEDDLSSILFTITRDIDEALSYHQAKRTQWAHKTEAAEVAP